MTDTILLIGGPRDSTRLETDPGMNLIGEGAETYWRAEYEYLGGVYVLYVHVSISDPIPVLLSGYRTDECIYA